MIKFSSQSVAFWQWILSMVLIALFCLHLWQIFPLGILAWVENFSYDLRLSLTPSQETDQRIHIIAIDEKSLQEVGRWPWSRNHVAKLVRHLFDHYRVNVLAIDMVFAEPDHSSGLQVLEGLAEKELRGDPGFQERMEQLRASLAYDHVLAQSLQGKPVVLGFVLNNVSANPNPRQQLPKPLLDLWETGHTKTTLPASENFIGNLEILQNAAVAGGFFSNPMVDSDGVTRRMPLIHRHQTNIYPSLALATIRSLLGNPATSIGFANMGANRTLPLIPQWIDVGNYRIPMDEQGAILVPYRKSESGFRHISAVDVLNKTLPANTLTGSVALLGLTATGLGDSAITPVQGRMSGVEVHANLVSGILDGRIKERSERLIWLDSAILIALCSLMILVGNASLLWNGLFATLSSTLLIAVNLLAWEKIHLVLALGTPMLAILSILLVNIGIIRAFPTSNKKTEVPSQPSGSPAQEDHQKDDAFWEDPPEAWRLDTSKLIIKDQVTISSLKPPP